MKPLLASIRPGAASASLLLVMCVLAGAPVRAHAHSGEDQLESLGLAFRTVYRQAEPSVVLVETSGNRATSRRRPFFHRPVEPEEGVGSGTIVSDDGYILSNHHVVKGTDDISVILSDRRSFPAEVVGFDSLIDIAVLKIDAEGLPAADLGSSDELEIGDWVLAIGHPLKMGATLTHGIVSALGREVDVIESRHSIESFIQTNAVINPGNSGGPLLNLRGEVVGINTAISTRTGYFIGYGLAVPIDLARKAMSDILVHGRVVRGYLGVDMLEIDQDLMDRLGMDTPRGVYLDSIHTNTPANSSGILRGDVLLAVDGVEVNHPNEVQIVVYNRRPGDALTLSITRQGEKREISLILGEREEDFRREMGRRRIDDLGLTIQTLSSARALELGFTSEIAAELGFLGDEEIIVVVDIESESPAAAKGIRVHDVITEIAQYHVSSMDEFVRFVSRLEVGKSALFWFWRRDRGIDVRALRIRG